MSPIIGSKKGWIQRFWEALYGMIPKFMDLGG